MKTYRLLSELDLKKTKGQPPLTTKSVDAKKDNVFTNQIQQIVSQHKSLFDRLKDA
jgi:hypothetical protein